jgi:CobQ-like glutamine amidotransferase family enzyme
VERPRINIGWLYPEYMNLYGDRGNVIVLEQRSRWHGLEPVITKVGLGQSADFRQFDLLMFGGGQDREQGLIAEDFLKVKGNSLGEAIHDGLAVLAVCGGFQMLGKHFKTHKGEMLRFTGILDLWTEGTSDRMIGNAIVESDIFGETRTLVAAGLWQQWQGQGRRRAVQELHRYVPAWLNPAEESAPCGLADPEGRGAAPRRRCEAEQPER